ncbi:MAG: hypothetical protein FJZ64_00710 [Chlamydiae bacterium]|nr:hypothetical protein [Chlamydiota bacterium]
MSALSEGDVDCGRSLVIGCGWAKNEFDREFGAAFLCDLHHGTVQHPEASIKVKKRDFVVSLDPTEEPDLVADMSQPDSWLGFPDRKFKVISLVDWGLGILDNPQVVEQMARVLKDDGFVIAGFYGDKYDQGLRDKHFLRLTGSKVELIAMPYLAEVDKPFASSMWVYYRVGGS